MEIINRKLSLHEFQEYVSTFNFGSKLPDKLVIHHTWRPTKEDWEGQRSINQLKAYYDRKDWPAGPHIFVAEDGIWLFSSMHKDGIHAAELNIGSIGIEIVGDYDREKWSGQTKYHALGVIRSLMTKLSLNRNQIHFHREVSDKTCPGLAITKEWLFDELNKYSTNYRSPELSPAMMGIQSISAPLPTPKPQHTNSEPLPLSPESGDIMVPLWAVESVAWVKKKELFEIKTQQDVRDAVKFHRFYKMIKKK